MFKIVFDFFDLNSNRIFVLNLMSKIAIGFKKFQVELKTY